LTSNNKITHSIPRKLYQGPRPITFSRQWTERDVNYLLAIAKHISIETINCLHTNKQLWSDGLPPNKLHGMDIYTGFTVFHRRITDPFYDYAGWQELEDSLPRIYQDDLAVKKPVLIHYGAGIDRSPTVARYIASREAQS